jgi:Zn finger protein HypA/HybF involved in hydrogenase expression
MGEYADMILDGTMCQGCGVFLNDEPPGYPCDCTDCARDRQKIDSTTRKQARQVAHQLHQARQKKTRCPICNRKVKEIGLPNHMKDSHPGANP